MATLRLHRPSHNFKLPHTARLLSSSQRRRNDEIPLFWKVSTLLGCILLLLVPLFMVSNLISERRKLP